MRLFRSRRPVALLALLGLVTAAVLASRSAAGPKEGAVAPPSPLPLEWCVERAARANPVLEAAGARAEAARHRIEPAGSLEDPRIRYEASNVPVGHYDFDSTPLSGHQFGLSQRLPFPGLLGAREDAARNAAEAERERLADRRLRVGAEAERAWARLGFAQRALAITERNVELLRQLSEIAEARYRVGDGLQQDVVRAQVELTALLDERLQRRAGLERAEAALAEVLDLPPETPLPRTAALADGSPVPPLEPLLASLEERSPRLHALRERVEQAERRVRVAELEGYPDVDLGIGYRLRQRAPGDPVEGDDYLSAGLTVRLPVDRSKWRERAAESRSELRRAKADYRAGRSGLRSAVRSAHAELERAAEQVRLLESGLVPQARQSLASSRSGYRVGRVDFLSLIDSQVSLLEAELGLVRAAADRRAAFAALEAAAGRTLR